LDLEALAATDTRHEMMLNNKGGRERCLRRHCGTANSLVVKMRGGQSSKGHKQMQVLAMYFGFRREEDWRGR